MRRTRPIKSVRRMRRSGNSIRPEIVKRCVVYGLLILFLSAAMSSFFANLRRLPATPDLLLGASLAIALLDNRVSAAIVAVVGGLTVDALGGVGISLSPLLYLIVVLTVGLFAEKMMPKFLSWLLLLLPSLLLRALFSLVGFWIYTEKISLSGVLWEILLPEAISTLVFCLPLYFLVTLCVIPLNDHRHHQALK